MATPAIVVIGGGNMGSSLIGGLIRNNHPPQQLWVTDQNEERLEQLKQDFHVHVTTDNLSAAKKADILILAVKPQMMAQVVAPLAEIVQARQPLIISIAAGIREASLATWLKNNVAIVRAMPNTPALIGQGATALFANAKVSATQRQMAESILVALGLVVWLADESMMDVVTALSGSGPAYFFLMMESLQQAAVEMGLDETIARQLTLQTAYGAAQMALHSETPLRELRRQVTSKGGTTEKAIAVLEDNEIKALFRKALQAAKIHSEEMARKMGT